ncbi:hypothetical protein C4D60_Mb08t07380 [Musa balbisiana]|uniref:DNA mismatch repair protein MutS core domain-containing protein n=1 Tax=Musa balbisiana TaxID=52838 RepID=A0A4S8K239_MUSBA|nr:hypothetical protein C4D60_Mb08t07380 [Musa balbisiana]
MEEEGGERSSFAVGLIGNRAKEVGVAAFDLRSASLHLSQYIETSRSYQNTKTLLHFYDPMVIIVPPTKLSADHMVGVSELVDKYYASNKKVTLPRGCFDDTKGAVLVKSLAAKEPSVLGLGTFYKQYYLCLAAAAATIKWIEAEKGVIVINRSLLVTFNGSFDHMNIDATSVQNLEIIDPLHSELWSTSNKKRSLFQMLKTTKTVGGARLLRANLLQPLKDIETINARLDCLSLRKFPKETDKVLCRFCFKPKKVTEEVLRPANGRKIQILISDIIVLKTALDALPFLSKVLKDAKSLLLHNIYRTVCENKNYEGMRKRFDRSDLEVVVERMRLLLSWTEVGLGLLEVLGGALLASPDGYQEQVDDSRLWKPTRERADKLCCLGVIAPGSWSIPPLPES